MKGERMDARTYFSNRLRAFRKASGMSVGEVGEAVGKNPKTISAWEVGRGEPSMDKLMELCSVFGRTVSDFYPADCGDGDQDERRILDLFRALDDDGRRVVLDVAEALARRG